MSHSNSLSEPSNLATPAQSSSATPTSNPVTPVQSSSATPASNPATPAQSDGTKSGIIVAVITGIFTVIVALIGIIPHIIDPPEAPTSTVLISTPPTTIVMATLPSPDATASITPLPSMPSPVIHLTSTPAGIKYRVRFVARPIPMDGLHNVYYSLDNGPEQFLFTAGHQVDHTFYPTFSHSIRVRVDIMPGALLYEELYINGDRVIFSERADSNGLTHQVP
jgi:hypothetical protein